MDWFIGTSGYSYKEWRGNFYPANAKPAEMLGLYARRLNVVEINNTFYRMPSERVLLEWAAQVPEDFSFVLKASRRITHQERLSGSESSLGYLLRTSAALGPRLGPLLFQLPPDFALDLPRLSAFLELLPRGFPAAFEFRHASWGVAEVRAALAARGAALVVADVDGEGGEEDDEQGGGAGQDALIATAEFGYLRMRRSRYDAAALEAWRERIAAAPWRRVFVFFKHEGDGEGPEMAARFRALAAGAS